MGITNSKRTKEEQADDQKRYRRTFSGTIFSKYYSSKKSAKEKGITHTLTPAFLKELWKKQKGLCAVSGVEMGFVGTGWCAGSIDRINPDLGYTPSNVQWTCWRINDAKSNMQNSDFVAMCYAVAVTVKLENSKKCNDYPEMEYDQVIGSGEHPEMDDDIVYSALEDAADFK
jgi:hypothetical protein